MEDAGGGTWQRPERRESKRPSVPGVLRIWSPHPESWKSSSGLVYQTLGFLLAWIAEPKELTPSEMKRQPGCNRLTFSQILRGLDLSSRLLVISTHDTPDKYLYL